MIMFQFLHAQMFLFVMNIPRDEISGSYNTLFNILKNRKIIF